MDDSEIAGVVSAHMRQAVDERRALSILLERVHQRRDRYLAIQAHLGEVASYVTSVTLRWLLGARFAADLPLFAEGIAGSRRVALDEDAIRQIRWHRPDWTRQAELTAWLAKRRQPGFGPLLLVAHQPWVSDRASEKWLPDGRALDDSLTLTQLEPFGRYWALDTADTLFYTFAGQHRLMAIRGLDELLRYGHLHRFGEKALSRDLLVRSAVGGDRSAMRQHDLLMQDRVGIEVVPEVRCGETPAEALRRLRRLLLDVNQSAGR